MASTFTTGFGIEKIGSGEQSGAWGTTTNHNLDILDRIASYKAVALSGSTHTLTVREASPGSGTENLQDGMYRVIKFTGALGANNTVTIAPNTAPAYFIFENATTDSGSSGPYSVILTQGSGANITIQNGKNAIVYCDGAGSGAAVVNALSDLQIATLEVTGAAAIDGAVTIGGALTGSSTIQGTTITATTAFVPDASDGAALGTTALEFSDLYLADGAVAAFGDDQDVTLTHVADTGLLLNSTRQLQFGDSGTYIHQSADGVLDLVSDTEIEINATTIDINGAVALSGAITGATNITLSGELDAATGDFSGAVDIDGALDVAGTTNLDVVDIDGAVNIAAATTIAAANKIQFRDAAIYLNSSADGQLDIVADTEIQIAATTIDINGAVALSGAITGATNITLSGELDAATGDFSGAVDIAGALTLGTDLAVAQGGTGAGTFAANGILYGAGTGAIAATAVGTDGHVLTSNGSGVAPTFQAAAGGATDIDGLSDALTNSSGATIGLGTGALAADDGSANNNTAVGYQALNDATTAAFNTAVGYQAMDSMTTSFGYSTAVGYQALSGATTAYGNTAMGVDALKSIVTTHNNTAFGRGAGATSTSSNSVMIGYDAGKKGGTGTTALGYDTLSSGSLSATYLTAVGSAALKNNTTGTNNAALGTDSLLDNTTGAGNTGVGMNAGIRNSTGGSNTFLGYNAGSKITTGSGNTMIGRDAGDASGPTTTSNNTFVGYYAGRFNPGTSNTLIGYKAGYGVSGSTTTGAQYMVAVGDNALTGITTGEQNTAVGWKAGLATTSGYRNSYLGFNAGNTTTTGTNNTFLGYDAEASSATVSNEITLGNASVTKFRIPGINFVIKDTTATDNYVLTVDSSGEAGWEAGGATSIDGLSDAKSIDQFSVGLGSDALRVGAAVKYNTAVGKSAGYTNENGTMNIYMGYTAGYSSTGTNNVFLGANSGYYATTGSRNTYVGEGAGKGTANNTAFNNIAVGANSLPKVASGAQQNTVVGKDSGLNLTTGVSNVFIGSASGSTTTTSTNNICIGKTADASSATVSNEITLGSSSISALRCQVQTISALSDRRDKKDIEELPLGIDFINTLKPVKFTWNMRDGAKVGQQEAGFIAQDLDEAQIDAGAEDYLSLVLKNNPEKLEASYGKLVPVLVKAVQDLSNEITKLKKEIKNG